MKTLQDALRGVLPPGAPAADAGKPALAARPPPPPAPPAGVDALPRPPGSTWAELLASHGVRPDREAPVAQWVQKTAAVLRQLEASGKRHDVRALKQARDEFLKLREKRAWEAVKARFEALELPEKAYRALKQEGADVEKVLARLHTRRAEEWRGMAAARVRDALLGS
jgi:hypothetical protein